MAVTLICPKLTCRAVLQVPDGVRGQRVRCGECGTAFLVPKDPRPGKAASRPAPPPSTRQDAKTQPADK